MSPRKLLLLPFLFSLPFLHQAAAQPRGGELYQQHCAVCHGSNLDGGLGGSLLIPELLHRKDGETIDESIARVTRDGLPDHDMQAFGDVLSEEELRAVVVYVRERRHEAEDREVQQRADGSYSTNRHDFHLETVVETDGEIWGLDFFPDGRILFTEKEGNLRILDKPGAEASKPIAGLPDIFHGGQGGLLEVAFHPGYEENGWIYLAYSEPAPDDSSRGLTTVARGRIDDHEWVDHENIWRAEPEHYTGSRHHYGTRISFENGYLYFTIGDRGAQDPAQDLTSPKGKTFRIHYDGRIPDDNPFVGHAEALPEIWSYGHRNAQGMDFHPETGQLWQAEHGPRGGDELNLIEPGLNYGWPVITYGINYNGTPLTGKTEKEGMEQPVVDWTPSIAVCPIAFYDGDRFPEWHNDLFVGGLAAQELIRVRLEGDKAVEEEVILSGLGRVRDVANGPDGTLYVALNLSRRSPKSQIVRLVPAE